MSVEDVAVSARAPQHDFRHAYGSSHGHIVIRSQPIQEKQARCTTQQQTARQLRVLLTVTQCLRGSVSASTCSEETRNARRYSLSCASLELRCRINYHNSCFSSSKQDSSTGFWVGCDVPFVTDPNSCVSATAPEIFQQDTLLHTVSRISSKHPSHNTNPAALILLIHDCLGHQSAAGMVET